MNVRGTTVPTDSDLVGAARQGDAEAFAVLLRRHRIAVVRACRRLLDDRFLAEDAFQEAAVTALTNLDRLRRPERFGAWLTGIGLNIGRGWLRSRREAAWSSEALLGGGWAPEHTGETDDPAAVAMQHDLARQVRRAVMALPAGQRRAVLGFYLLGLPHWEVAALLDTTPGAVKTRLHKARATLRVRLSELWEETMMTDTPNAVTVRVADVYALDADGPLDAYVVVLAELEGDRRLPIWIGEPEATALALALQGAELARPMTYQCTVRLLEAAGGRVHEAHVTRLSEGTFYATVTVDGPKGRIGVDVRPSDAFNIALLAGAPITVDAAVFEAAEAAAAAGADGTTVESILKRVRATSEEILQRHNARIAAMQAATGHGRTAAGAPQRE